MKKRTWITAGVGTALLLAAFGWAFRPQPLPVESATAERATFEQTIDEDGRTRVRERYVISAPLGGRISRIRLQPGDAVEAGKPVAAVAPTAPALLDARTARELQERVGAAQAALAQSKAELARALSSLEQAQADLARQARLQGEGFIAPAAREQAELAVRVQQRAVEAAHAGVDAAEHTVAQARAAQMRARRADVEPNGVAVSLPIISPVSGRVLKVAQESENVVMIGTPLMEVADPSHLEVVVDVLSTEALRIKPGAAVRIDAGGLALDGSVRRVEPAAFTKVSALGVEEQRVNVIIDLVSAPERWRVLGDGYRVDARIVTRAEAGVVVVPVAALFRHGDGWAVYVIADGRVQLRGVRVGARNPTQALVEEGVNPGDRVVVYPSDVLAEGRRVKVVRAAS